ncbi:MAG: hypothetical protein NVSMB52_08910 [Chloroflexota bacterium]
MNYLRAPKDTSTLQRHIDRSIQISRPWGRLQVHVWGNGPAILALHGLGGSGRYWAGLATALHNQATIIAPDYGGFGASDKPRLQYDRTFHLENLEAVVERLPAPPRIVVGHSMGGIVAALWSARQSHEVQGLALVATPYPSNRTVSHNWEARSARSILRRAVQLAWPVLTLPYRSALYPREVVLDYARHTPVSYWRTAYGLIWDPSVIAELAPLGPLSQQRLLLYAQDDRQVPLSAQEKWGKLLPESHMVVLQTGGHQLLLASHFEPLVQWLHDVLGFPTNGG